MIEIENLSKTYDSDTLSVSALREVNFQIKKGEFVAIMGPSGSGKSTLAKCIFRLMEIKQDGGSIEIDKLDISKIELEVLRRNITMIPQDPTLFALKQPPN